MSVVRRRSCVRYEVSQPLAAVTKGRVAPCCMQPSLGGRIWAPSVAIYAVAEIPALMDFRGAGVASIWVSRLSRVLLVWFTVPPGMGGGGVASGCCGRSQLPFPSETGKLRPGRARALCLACGVGHCFATELVCGWPSVALSPWLLLGEDLSLSKSKDKM